MLRIHREICINVENAAAAAAPVAENPITNIEKLR